MAEKSDEPTLSALLQQAIDSHARLQSMPASSQEAKDARSKAIDQLEQVQKLMEAVSLFSSNETFEEHSSSALKCVLADFYLADMVSRTTAAADDPQRDIKRLQVLQRAKAIFRQFLEHCVELKFPFIKDMNVTYYLTMKAGARRERDMKIAHMKRLTESEKKLKELSEQLKAAETTGSIDEDRMRDHVLQMIECAALKACDQLESLMTEENMLEQMKAHNFQVPARPTQPSSSQGGRPPELIKLTADKVQEMVATGGSIEGGNFRLLAKPTQPGVSGIDRSKFNVVTDGYGRIGKPTMTEDEYFEKEVREGKIVLPPAPGPKPVRRGGNPESDEEHSGAEEDNNDLADIATMRAREADKVNDYMRRGDGNRYNKG